MNSRLIIIAILIFVKIIGVASRVRAEDYSSCYSVKKINHIVKKENYYNPTFRCGNNEVFNDV